MAKPPAGSCEVFPDGYIGRLLPLIPPGKYQVSFVEWWTGRLFGRSEKIALRFAICDPGEHFGVDVNRWYNIALRGRIGRNGGFVAPFNGDLLREYVHLVGSVRRNDRIALSKYRNHVLIAAIDTVTTDRLQRVRHDVLQYSVVRSLIGVAAGPRAFPSA
jgi:hypothetical protein